MGGGLVDAEGRPPPPPVPPSQRAVALNGDASLELVTPPSVEVVPADVQFGRRSICMASARTVQIKYLGMQRCVCSGLARAGGFSRVFLVPSVRGTSPRHFQFRAPLWAPLADWACAFADPSVVLSCRCMGFVRVCAGAGGRLAVPGEWTETGGGGRAAADVGDRALRDRTPVFRRAPCPTACRT